MTGADGKIDVSKVIDEKGVKRLVKNLLDQAGFFWWMPPANGYGTTGVHDFNAIKDGTFLTIETKFGKRKPTPMQTAFAGSIMASGGIAFCVNETNIDHLAWFLQSYTRATAAVAAAGDVANAESSVDQADGARMLNAVAVLTDGFK